MGSLKSLRLQNRVVARVKAPEPVKQEQAAVSTEPHQVTRVQSKWRR